MLKKVTMKTINAIYFVSKGCKLLPCVALALQKVDQARAAKKKTTNNWKPSGTGVQLGFKRDPFQEASASVGETASWNQATRGQCI